MVKSKLEIADIMIKLKDILNEVSVYKKLDVRGVKNALDTLIKSLLMQVRFSKAHKNKEVDSVIEDVLDDFKSKLRTNTGIRL